MALRGTAVKTSSVLSVGEVYTRIGLAERFGITDATLTTGIFRPAGHDSVWLFVTEKKTPDRTQYQDHLDGDTLSWDGQTSGRKDALIIGHEAQGLELLVFYRQSKNEFGNYGFRYEGPFRYVSSTGKNPAHFTLVRVQATSPADLFTLRPVETPADLLGSLLSFNREARRNPDRTRSILRSTTYWVFHPSTGTFGPGKFVGYAGMTFAGYEAGNQGQTDGAKFDGHVTKTAIESALGADFGSDDALRDRLLTWAAGLIGRDPFGNANPDKWQFAVLDEEDTEPAEELASEPVVEELERRQARGQGFLLSPALRKALEDHAMDAATRYFQAEGYAVADHSKTKPYDLYCTRGAEVLHVEVKGTQTGGEDIILTAGEVEFARRHRGQMALFVLHSVEVSGEEGEFVLSEGERHLVLPWDVDQGMLKPVSYTYGVPGRESVRHLPGSG